MRCLDCGEREATVVYVVGTPGPRRAVPSDERPQRGTVEEGGASPDMPSPRGPNVCVVCAQRRYDARRPPGAPTWEEFLAMAHDAKASRPAP